MGKLSTLRVPVDSGFVFVRGVMFVSVEKAVDFDLRGKVEDAQARDKETGARLWTLMGIDMDLLRQLQSDEERQESSGFRQSAEVKVTIVSEQRPVPPHPQVPGFAAVIEFEGLTLTPYPDRQRCRAPEPGRAHRCGAWLAWSMRATGIREFAGLASAPA